MSELTIRQQIVMLLKQHPRTALALSSELSVKTRQVEEHLIHIRKSSGKSFIIYPSKCLNCDFIFRDRERVTTPSRCPKCKEEGLEPPIFEIKEIV